MHIPCVALAVLDSVVIDDAADEDVDACVVDAAAVGDGGVASIAFA
jgi:hypothetical protein